MNKLKWVAVFFAISAMVRFIRITFTDENPSDLIKYFTFLDIAIATGVVIYDGSRKK